MIFLIKLLTICFLQEIILWSVKICMQAKKCLPLILKVVIFLQIIKITLVFSFKAISDWCQILLVARLESDVFNQCATPPSPSQQKLLDSNRVPLVITSVNLDYWKISTGAQKHLSTLDFALLDTNLWVKARLKHSTTLWDIQGLLELLSRILVVLGLSPYIKDLILFLKYCGKHATLSC